MIQRPSRRRGRFARFGSEERPVKEKGVEEGVAAAGREAAGKVVQLELKGVGFGVWVAIIGILLVVIVVVIIRAVIISVAVVVAAIVIISGVGCGDGLLFVPLDASSNDPLHPKIQFDEGASSCHLTNHAGNGQG